MSTLQRIRATLAPDRPISPITGELLEAPSLENPKTRRALTTSLAAHVGALLLVLLAGASLPAPPTLPNSLNMPRLVFLAIPGPGGGGGGGGARLQGPPSVQKIKGKDRAALAVNVEKPTKPAERVKKEEPPPQEEQVKAPVVAQSPSDMNEKGILEGQEQVVPSTGSGGGGGAGTGQGAGIGPGDGSGIGEGWGGGFGGGAYQVGSGVTPPVLRRQVKPGYTEKALSRKIQGKVTLEIIIRRDGTVGDVRIVRGLDPGLDVKAIEAVRQWLFVPGRLEGQAVDVLAEVQVGFTLL